MTRHLIVGGGPAAINAMETIREVESEPSEIVLICDEPAYSRMVLPYYLAKQIPEQQVFTGDDDYFKRLNVTTKIGERVTSIDPQNQTISLDGGGTESFDRLLIATGSSAAMPPIPGTDLPGVYPLWTLSHTQAVLAATENLEKPDVVFLGAGFIGFIVLNAMYKRGWNLSVVEMAEHVLPRMLNADSAKLVEQWLRRKNVDLHLGSTAKEITEHNGRKKITLANGTTLEADLVIVATGITTNKDLVSGSGIKTDQGILVNDQMQTSSEHVYAAGDVAQGPDLLGDQPAVHAIQPTAVDHGRIAGANMAGLECHYPGSLLMNILDVCGLQCASFGRWGEETEAMTIVNEKHPVYRRMLWTGEQMTGAILIGPANELGMLNDVGMIKGIIQTKVSMGNWKEYLRENPFDVRRAYIANKVGQKLIGTTLLGRKSKPRQYRHQGAQAQPQVTDPKAHQVYVDAKK